MKNRESAVARHAVISSVALLAAGLAVWSTGAVAQTKMAPATSGRSNSIVGIPIGSPNSPAGEPTAAKAPSRPAPMDNFYGASPPGTFTNTSTAQGPPSTLPPGLFQGSQGTPAGGQSAASQPPAQVQNPNGVVVNAQGPVSNGTGQPLISDTSVPVPVMDTGQAENPQESPSALGWIVLLTIMMVGSVYGLIKWTQPGGVA